MDGQRTLIHKLLDGELTEKEKQELLDRMETDPHLREAVMELNETVRLVETSGRLSPPSTFAAEIISRLPEQKAPVIKRVLDFFLVPRALRWNVATAMALILVVLTLSLVIMKRGEVQMAHQTSTEKQTILVQFRLYAPEAKSVSLAGEFNRWLTNETLLMRRNGGLWSVEINLEPGTYSYMFVIDGQEWVPDPDADLYRDDGFGYKNSVRRVYSF